MEKKLDSEALEKKLQTLADDLICPISLELPWNPVMAEDGHVYDRASIEEYFKSQQGKELRSPTTNQKMGQKLLPATQIRNTIQGLVESGVIGGDLEAQWNARVQEKKAEVALLKKAEGGDAEAMYNLGVEYLYGRGGFKKDQKLGFQWCMKAHAAGSLAGTTAIGVCFLEGLGVARDSKRGMFYSTLAAGQGSNFAAFKLGFAFANGQYGMYVDKAEAVHWFTKAVADGPCQCALLPEDAKRKAQMKLDEIQKKSNNRKVGTVEKSAIAKSWKMPLWFSRQFFSKKL